MRDKLPLSYKVVIHTVMILFSLLCIIPIILVLSISFSGEMDIIKNGYSIWPAHPTFVAYSYVFGDPSQILSSYFVTITVTILGTLFGMLLTSSIAYVISRKDYAYANKTSFYVFFTMLFSGGMVPWYILISRVLHMKDTIFALFVPYLVVPWFVLLIKGFMSSIPQSIIESAKIDGASEYRIFFKMILPVSKPGLATVSLFCVLMYWNDYWLSLMFIQNSKLISLQFLLWRIMSNLDFLNSALAVKSGGLAQGAASKLPSLTARMAICVIAVGPMLFVFPFFQKYFVKGLTVGSVKG